MSKSDSFVRNCYLIARDGGAPLFVPHEDGLSVVARLDGYVVCPKEQLQELAARLAADEAALAV